MNVIFLAPAYPAEMPHYTRGLAEVGARVFGVGDQPASSLSPGVRACLHDYLQVPRLMDEADVVARVRAWLGARTVDRVESLWEPLVLLAARLREALGVPGMSVDTVLGFRDKQVMKERVAAAGLRVPFSFRVTDEAGAWAAAERVGYPLILKPIAGAGSADTFRCDSPAELRSALQRTRHVPEVSVEEFIDGEEFTYDTICVDGRPVYENVAQYLPRPLIARTNEWISPVVITVRDMSPPRIHEGVSLGRGVMQALGMGTGFTHMEWYRKPNGEVVFGEIGCRVGGARLADQMNYTSDIDVYREWARAVVHGHVRIEHPRRYNVAIVFKRALGQGRITRVAGLGQFMAENARWVCVEDLLPVGAHRRDWKQTLVSDGYLIVRHPTWDGAIALAQQVQTGVQLYAGG